MMNEAGDSHLRISEYAGGVTFGIHVQPRASRTEICGIQGEELKLRITSPPVDDAANKLCVEFLAKQLGVAKSQLQIIAGAKSRHKTIRADGVTRSAVLKLVV